MGIKNILKKLLKLIEWIIFILLILILLLVASPLLPTKKYVSTHVVSTGSMEPTIKAGSVVLSSLEIEEINRGDIIVFTSPENEEITIVHRVMDIENNEYFTKGDNNENDDDWTVFKDNIKGKVFLTIPYLGYAIEWMKTPLGFITILVLPALLLIISFIKRIKDGINDEVEKRTKEEIIKRNLDKEPPILVMIALITTTILITNTPNVYALFSSSVSLTGLTIAVGEIEEEKTIPIVVINEIMWSGTSQSSDDQWIELWNTTDNDIDIGKWKIEYLRDTGKPPIMIPANKVIPANGYFVISNYSNESENSMLNIEVNMSNASINLLPTQNDNLVLKNKEGKIIDQVLGVPDWPEDIQSDTYKSMQRYTNGINGLLPSSWYTCESELCKSSNYWKISDGLNFGSPGSINIPN